MAWRVVAAGVLSAVALCVATAPIASARSIQKQDHPNSPTDIVGRSALRSAKGGSAGRSVGLSVGLSVGRSVGGSHKSKRSTSRGTSGSVQIVNIDHRNSYKVGGRNPGVVELEVIQKAVAQPDVSETDRKYMEHIRRTILSEFWFSHNFISTQIQRDRGYVSKFKKEGTSSEAYLFNSYNGVTLSHTLLQLRAVGFKDITAAQLIKTLEHKIISSKQARSDRVLRRVDGVDWLAALGRYAIDLHNSRYTVCDVNQGIDSSSICCTNGPDGNSSSCSGVSANGSVDSSGVLQRDAKSTTTPQSVGAPQSVGVPQSIGAPQISEPQSLWGKGVDMWNYVLGNVPSPKMVTAVSDWCTARHVLTFKLCPSIGPIRNDMIMRVAMPSHELKNIINSLANSKQEIIFKRGGGSATGGKGSAASNSRVSSGGVANVDQLKMYKFPASTPLNYVCNINEHEDAIAMRQLLTYLTRLPYDPVELLQE